MGREEVLYLKLAGRLRSQIEKDVWRPGGRLPSVRDLSREQDVSVSTVLQAYAMLESQGFVEARPQSGYYVKSRFFSGELKPFKGSASPRKIASHDALINVIDACGNPSFLPLGAAILDQSLLPWEALSKNLAKVARRKLEITCNYGVSGGAEEYRREVARRSLSLGCEFLPEDVHATLGAMEAISLALSAVTKPGDVVAIESPTYHGTIEALRSHHLRVLEIATDPQTGMDLDDLQSKISQHSVKAILVTPNFNNPLGSVMSEESKSRLAQLAARHEIPVIEDDVYGDLALRDHRHPVLKAHDKKDWVLLCSSFSKTLAPGFRAGWMVPGPRFAESIKKHKFARSVSSVTATHLAVADYLKSHSYDRHLRTLRAKLAGNIHSFSQKVRDTFPAGTRLSQPQGGVVIWVELPGKTDTLELHSRALEEGISIVPGSLFSPTGRFRNCLRLTAGNPWTPSIEKAVEKVAELIRK